RPPIAGTPEAFDEHAGEPADADESERLRLSLGHCNLLARWPGAVDPRRAGRPCQAAARQIGNATAAVAAYEAGRERGRRRVAKSEQSGARRGRILPPPMTPPPGVVLPFAPVRLIGERALFSGHGPQSAAGPMAEPLGKLGRDLSVEQGYAAAR